MSILLIFYKVWCGYVKFLSNQVIGKSKLVQCPVFGTFLPSSTFIKLNNVIPEEGEVPAGTITKDNLAKLENMAVCWAPNVQLLENL